MINRRHVLLWRGETTWKMFGRVRSFLTFFFVFDAGVLTKWHPFLFPSITHTERRKKIKPGYWKNLYRIVIISEWQMVAINKVTRHGFQNRFISGIFRNIKISLWKPSLCWTRVSSHLLKAKYQTSHLIPKSASVKIMSNKYSL